MDGHSMNWLQITLFVAFAGAAMAANVHWYRLKSLLRSRGLPSGWFTNHYNDFKLLAQAVAAETDAAQREELLQLRQRIRHWLIVTFALFGCFMGTFLLGMFTANP
jgi:hypothetical protein